MILVQRSKMESALRSKNFWAAEKSVLLAFGYSWFAAVDMAQIVK